MTWLKQSITIKTAITNYAAGINEAEYSSTALAALLSPISAELGSEITIDLLCNAFFLPLPEYKTKSLSLLDLIIYTELEKESLQRITQIKEKNALTLSVEELEQLGLQFFCMSKNDYKEMIKKQKLIQLEDPNNPVEFYFDAVMPFHIASKLHGTDISVQTIATKLKERKNNFGMVGNEYEYKLQRIADKSYMMPINSIEALFREHLELYGCFTKKAQKNNEVQSVMSARNTITPPQKTATLVLDYHPLQIVFTSDNQLVILASKQSPIELAEQQNYIPRILQIINPETGEIIARAETNDSIGMSLFSFKGFFTGFDYKDTLTIGLDDTIYIDGGRNRFTKNAEQIISIRDSFAKALAKLAKSHYFVNDSYTMIAVHETKDDFLYLANRSYLGKNDATLFMVSKTNQDISSLNFSPNSGMCITGSEEKPRITLNNTSLFLRKEGQLFEYNLNLFNAQTPIASDQVVIPYKRGDFMPSYHCFDTSGKIWALTMENGEIHPSIKTFERKDGKWQFATYFYPENCEFSYNRSLAISKSGILAYSNSVTKSIDLYRL